MVTLDWRDFPASSDPDLDPQDVLDAPRAEEVAAVVDRAAEEAGRDPSAILRASSLSISEPWDEVRAAFDRMAGGRVGYLMIDWPSEGLGRLEEFLEQVLPTLA